MEKIKLLLVEDEPDWQFVVRETLNLTGRYEIRTADNGKEGLKLWGLFKPDVIVADVIMPEMNGLEMVKEIRKKDQHVRIILATAKNGQADISEGLDLDIDNYITKPYTSPVLDKYIQALFRDAAKYRDRSSYQMGSYIFDRKMRQLKWKDKIFKLTPLEANVLLFLINHQGEAVDRDQILQNCWIKETVYDTHSLNVVISKLRDKLKNDPAIWINTCFKGYQFVLCE